MSYCTHVQLKHYRASSKVMQRAEELYGKLKGLYMHPKLVVRPPKKKTAGGAGIRKRPPTMPELLNNQVNNLDYVPCALEFEDMCKAQFGVPFVVINTARDMCYLVLHK